MATIATRSIGKRGNFRIPVQRAGKPVSWTEGPNRFRYSLFVIRLFNSETGRAESASRREGAIRLYVCGITPYDTTHLGHAYTYITFDVLRRTFQALGHAVRYVQNVTDIDDDILRRANELHVTWDVLAQRETALYEADMAALNVQPPDVFPRASATIPRIIDLVRILESRGDTYTREGTVFFRVSSRPDYGRLSQLSRDDMIRLSRERGADPDDPRKEDPLDFILWQRSQPGEPAWPSPWSAGRPGWHIECSAMALEHLGPQVDIHGGGADLIYPHHESEIAQSESVTGVRPFARIWTHVGMLRYAGQKMSKSLKNLVLVRDLLTRYDADAIRVALLRHHYRDSWEFRPEDLEAAAEWTAAIRTAARPPTVGAAAAGGILEALQDDLNTPRALTLLQAAVAEADPGWRAGADLLGLRLVGDAADVGHALKRELGKRR
jgi:L-cysteine:1D-myo-inositol 2-amino-2-deoxy-alpha-D-glucopyranoside ligase